MYKYYYSEEQKALYGSGLVFINNKWVEFTILILTYWDQIIYKKCYKDVKLVAESENLLPTKEIENTYITKENIEKGDLITWNPMTQKVQPVIIGIDLSKTNDYSEFKQNINDFITNNSFETRLNNLKKDIDESLRQGHKKLFMELSEEYKRLVEM